VIQETHGSLYLGEHLAMYLGLHLVLNRIQFLLSGESRRFGIIILENRPVLSQPYVVRPADVVGPLSES
jgi:hypothetical protein